MRTCFIPCVVSPWNLSILIFFETLIRWIKLGLQSGIIVIFRRCSFIGESNHFILNVFWWENVWFHVLFSLGLYQIFFVFLETLTRCNKLGLGFFLKVIFRRCKFRYEINHFIYNDFWWKYVCNFFWNFGILLEAKLHCCDINHFFLFSVFLLLDCSNISLKLLFLLLLDCSNTSLKLESMSLIVV